MHRRTFKFLQRDWIMDKPANQDPSGEEQQILHHLMAMQADCNTDLYPPALVAVWHGTKNFSTSSWTLKIGPRTSSWSTDNVNSRTPSVTVPKRDTSLSNTQKCFIFVFCLYSGTLSFFVSSLVGTYSVGIRLKNFKGLSSSH